MKPPDGRSEAAKAYRGWYSTPEWHRIRGKRLHEEKVCRVCAAQKAIDPSYQPDPSWALIVDHVTPHRGNWKLFSDYSNTMTLCSHHHNSAKQAFERRPHVIAVGADGWPIGDRP